MKGIQKTMKTQRTYELMPNDGRKSFYHKAYVVITEEDGSRTETLYSYGTKIISRLNNGSLVKYWDGYSATTQRHINAFCGLNKAQYTRMPAVA